MLNLLSFIFSDDTKVSELWVKVFPDHEINLKPEKQLKYEFVIGDIFGQQSVNVLIN